MLCAPRCLACWLHKEFWEDPEHIALSPLTVLEAKLHFYLRHLELLPLRFHCYNRSRWEGMEFYSYINWKEKCFQDNI